LLRHQGIQLLRSLRAVRRPFERAHLRSASIPDAVEQEHAAAHGAGRDDAAYADQARSLQGQDRRQGRHAYARGARRLSESEPAQGRLLADRGGARRHAEASGEELKARRGVQRARIAIGARAANENPAGAGPAGVMILQRPIVRRAYPQTAPGRPRPPTTLPYMSYTGIG